MLRRDETFLLFVDVQGKLAQLIHDRDALFGGLGKLLRGAAVLGLPTVWTEQNPAGLGPTVPELAELIAGEPIPKLAFSCWREEACRHAIEELPRMQALLCGIEAHVCICQTALDLLKHGYAVHVVADAVSSRTETNRRIGLERMAAAGAVLTSVEMALFELAGVAEGAAFKELLRIVK